MAENANFVEDLISIINEKQQVTYNELKETMFSRGVPKGQLDSALSTLESRKAIASRSSGGILTYYLLQQENELRKILIVEDDKNINKLMALSIGKGFEVSQIYDGGEAIPFIRENKPNLVVLDLMLPNKDGLDICQTVKSDSSMSNTIIILVSAMDPTNNRFKGIKNGADYYIKKPFDPIELRSLVTLFLKKKGKRFDPLIDLPDEERISKEIERSLKEGERYTIGTLKVDGLSTYVQKFGEQSAMVILRLISQLLQDIIKNKSQGVFSGFLNTTEFVVAGEKENVEASIRELQGEFTAVLPFILQDEGYNRIDLNIESLFESKEVPKLSLVYTETEREKLKERRDEILESRNSPNGEIGAYTYNELQKLFGKDNLDISITRDSSGVRLKVGKSASNPEDE
ncbi:response regulator transcription factor [Candidatus Marsarchaeota archaeon]|nr:response regulator transcription factor [Candidatus Marsarchaeota archaeon]MCL5092659.1 response regulator transcription factor [Candidatus Marsarchaeota archaeon]